MNTAKQPRAVVRRSPSQPGSRARQHPAPALLEATLQLQRTQIRVLQDHVATLNAQLRLEAEQGRQAAHDHPVACVQLLASGIIRDASESAVELLGGGGDKAQIIYKPLRAFLSSGDIEPLYRHLHQCLTAGSERRQIETEVSLKTTTGLKPVRLVSKPVSNRGHARDRLIPTALVDMTECRASHHWLALEDRNFQRLLESIDGIVWEAEYPFRLRFVSPQIERILGFPPECWMRDAAFWQSRIHRDDRERVVRERDAAIRAGGHQVIDYRIYSAAGDIVWLRDSVFVGRDPQGHTRIQGLAVNVTALKQAEAELRRANQQLGRQSEQHRRHLEETVHSMETFCYGIAHELRAPVRSMQGFSQVLLRDLDNSKREDYLRRIATSASRLDQLITDLLAYGRLHHTELLVVPTDIKGVIDRVLNALSDEISQSGAEVRIVPTSARVMAHPMLLVQALQNLVSNAIKFVPAGAAPHVRIATKAAAENSIRISVCDHGIGITPEYGEKIFGIFQRGQVEHEYPGTGVGLAMVKRIVELLNGRVGFDPARKKGSCFWIELPAAASLP